MPGIYITRENLKKAVCSKNTTNIALFINEWIKNPWGLEMLIDLNVDCKNSQVGADKGNILHFAAINGQKEFIEVLFKHYNCSYILNKVSEKGYTPLMYSKVHNKFEIVDILAARVHENYINSCNNPFIYETNAEKLKYPLKEYIFTPVKEIETIPYNVKSINWFISSKTPEDYKHQNDEPLVTCGIVTNVIYLDE
ncbi:MAG: Ankyrin repeat (3 copies) [Rickettsiaceae bacterium]|jgi:ankyrin repeat protein|nr:Ankyrin repeat (3 copies) [Rickettsiaceae bacterium]